MRFTTRLVAGYFKRSLIAALVVILFLTWRAIGQSSNQVSTVSAASYGSVLAPSSVAAAFGTGMATRTEVATGASLPTSLAGTTVRVNGELAQLFFVSPNQINYLIPSGTVSGDASVVVTSGDGVVSTGIVRVAAVAPALFTANADGVGPLSALLLRVKADNQLIYEPLARYDQQEKRFVTAPIDFGEDGDQLFLILFLTGVRHAPAGSVLVSIGGVEYAPLFVGPQGSFTGLDQINVALPRTFGGRGRISLLIKANPNSASNAGEIEIGSGSRSSGLRIVEPNRAVLAGEEMELSGSGFAASPQENQVQIVGDDGAPAKVDVLAVNASSLRLRVPYGAGTGQIKVNRGSVEAGAPIRVRTSLSGFVERAVKQNDGATVRSPIRNARVRALNNPAVETVTNNDGSFVLADVEPGNKVEFEVLPPADGSLNFPSKKFPWRVRPDRDNQLPRGDEQTLITGVPFPVANETHAATALTAADLTLTFLEPGRTPANLPIGHYSTSIAQLSPFGTAITPGAKLNFPNSDLIPAGSQATLFKFDQKPGSETLGQFIAIGAATVASDGQLIETTANAITEGSFYFVSIQRPTAAISGRVIERSGRPAPRAIVQVRGQSTFTDGFGGFVLRGVPVMKTGRDLAKLEVSYQRPDGRVSRKDVVEVELSTGVLATVGQEIVLDQVTNNFPPVILAPSSLTVVAGETRDFDLFVADPNGNEPPRVAAAGLAASFANLSSQGQGVYRLRLSPPANAAGSYTLDLIATGSAGERNTQSVAVAVIQSGNEPIAHAQSVATQEDLPLAITLTGIDSGGRALNFTVTNNPTRGNLNGAPPNLIYTPALNYNGVDSFTFKTSNGVAESKEATVFIAVRPVNDAPVLNAPGSQFANAGETLSLWVTARDVDEEQELKFDAMGLPPGANFVEVSGTSGLLIWTPTIDQTGSYLVGFTVTDQAGASVTKSVSITTNAKWAKTSGPEGGDIRSFVFVDGILYAATHGAGVFRSADNGRSWAEVSEGISSQGLYVRKLMANGLGLYAGTADGVFYSGDNGQNWISISNGLENESLSVLSFVALGNIFYVGTDGGGVYRLSDDGFKWIPVNNGLSGAALQVNALLASGPTLYAGTYGGGVFRTTDGGNSWTPLNNGLSGLSQYVESLQLSGTSLYAGTYSKGVYRLTNTNRSGQSWEEVNNGFPNNEQRIEVLLANETSLYAGTYGGGVFVSTNGGQNWSPINNGLLGIGVYVYELFVNGANWYAGTLEGVYRSIDGGRRWNPSSAGIVASSVSTLLDHSTGLYAGTFGGVYRSTDNGQSWTPVNSGLSGDGFRVNVLSANGNDIYAGTYGGGVYRSTDGGQSWTAINNGLSDRGLYIYSLAVSGTTLFAGTDGGGVYRSIDGGQNWTPVNNGFPDSRSLVFALQVNGADLYAGTFRNGVYRSSDNEQSWTAVNNGLSGDALYVFAFAQIGNNLYAGTRGGVYRSTDKGQSWTALSDGLPDQSLFILELLASGNNLYAGTSGSAYRLSDDGQRWSPLGTDLVNPTVISMAVSGSRIFAGTDGNGVSLLIDSAQNWSEIGNDLTNKFVNAVTADSNNLYVGTLGSGVFRSAHQGRNWTAAGDGLPSNANIQSIVTDGSSYWVATFGDGIYYSTDPGRNWTPAGGGLTNRFVNELFISGSTLYAGTDGGVFRSTNEGKSWTAINTGLSNQRVVSFAARAGVIFAGTDGGGVFRLNDDGESWTPASRGLISLAVTALAANGDALYAGASSGGVSISRDNGENWTPVNNRLSPTLNVNSFATSGKKVYAGTIYGVFVTEDDGQSWRQVNAGLLDLFVTGLVVSGDRLFAGTASGGVFVSRIP